MTHFITTNGVTHAVKERKRAFDIVNLTGTNYYTWGKQSYVSAVNDQSPGERYIFFILLQICVSWFLEKNDRSYFQSKKILFDPILWFSVDMAGDTR